MAVITLLAGLLVTLTGGAGIAVGTWHDRGAFAAGPVPFVAVPRGPAEVVPGPSSGSLVPDPVFLTVPAIGVRTRLIRLGTTRQGTLQVPASTSVAGWYTSSPRPGAIGSSIIAGHIDSYTGPGVFFRLRMLRPGDRVYIRRTDGTLAVFAITAVRVYLKTAFPTAAVYGPVPDVALRLISCGGAFDRITGSYLSNVVAYAVEVSRRTGSSSDRLGLGVRVPRLPRGRGAGHTVWCGAGRGVPGCRGSARRAAGGLPGSAGAGTRRGAW